MARTGQGIGQSTPAASGWPVAGTATAYAAAIVASAYALVSLYCALGEHALVSTTGGNVEQFARRGAALTALVTIAATMAEASLQLTKPRLTSAAVRVTPSGE